MNTVGNPNGGTGNGFGYAHKIVFGPDGNLYMNGGGGHVGRMSLDGTFNIVVDHHINELGVIHNVAFDLESNLYLVARLHGYIYRVDSTGTITTVAGVGWEDGSDDGSLARTAKLDDPSDIAFGSDGSLYIGTARHIRHVGLDGIINTIAGKKEWCATSNGDGEPAIAACLTRGYRYIALGADGSLYLANDASKRIRRIDSNGIINTIAGNGKSAISGDGGPALKASFKKLNDITFGPDGNLYVADDDRIRRIRSIFPGFYIGNILIVSENGEQLYEFSPEGRHLRTLDTLTGKTRYTFTYNQDGYLVAVQDLDNDITRIERENNQPVAIIAPDGQRTTLTLDANGYLNSITNPANETYQLHYRADGLLAEFIDPRQNKSIYKYNELGFLIEDINAAGGGWTLARTEHSAGGYTTTMTSKAGRISRFKVEPLSNGNLLRTNTAPDNTVVTTLKETNGTTTVTRPDGTIIVSQEGPDPRFGMQAPLLESLTVTTPSGLSTVTTITKTAQLADTDNPLSLAQLTTKTTVNDRTSKQVYDATNQTVINMTPEGRQTVSFLDDKGRVIKEQLPELTDLFYRYDERGRLIEMTVGEGEEARTTTFSYDDKSGYLSKITDALKRETTFIYDDVGRVLTEILPEQREIHYSYDKNGNLTSITPPGQPTHHFDYTPVDQPAQYSPPVLNTVPKPQTQYQYNLDKQITQITRPDGQSIDFTYNLSSGQLIALHLPHGQKSYEYDTNTGQLMTITAADGSTLSYTYDGMLSLSETWGNSSITGTLSYTYDNDFRVIAIRVNDSHAIHYQYDQDSLLTQAGDLSLTYHQQNGLLTETQLGNLITQRTYNSFGEIDSEIAHYSDEARYSNQYHYDKLGRITQKIETITGITTTYDYHYDQAGRLKTVKQDGIITDTYTYDSNGNRLSANTASGFMQGSYDDQDRLIQYGDTTYEYTENGELHTKRRNHEITRYHYDVLGNLRTVELPNDKKIEYLIDGENRRIGKKVDGILVQGFLYQDDLNPIAELDAQGNIVTRFVYGSKAHVPDYMVKENHIYRILSDHLGSPRLVIDIEDGSVIQKMDYDVFGNVIFDSNPGFQPFGFAGGIYDVDTGLVRFGARDYDAEVGRWVAKDPIMFDGGSANLYGYVEDDPVNFSDPSGNEKYTGILDKPIYINMNDHFPPHAHVGHPKSPVKLDLNTGEIYTGKPTGKGGSKKILKKLKNLKIIPGIGPVIVFWSLSSKMEKKGFIESLFDELTESIVDSIEGVFGSNECY